MANAIASHCILDGLRTVQIVARFAKRDRFALATGVF